MRFYNAIKDIDLNNERNALGAVQKCITGIFVFDLERFIEIFDKLLRDSGDSHELVKV